MTYYVVAVEHTWGHTCSMHLLGCKKFDLLTKTLPQNVSLAVYNLPSKLCDKGPTRGVAAGIPHQTIRQGA